jgi:hypothetical protein
MRIPASVLKGMRVGLSGTSLALAVGCSTQPSSLAGSDESITREAPAVAVEKPGSALDKRDSPRWSTETPAVSRVETAPPSSPFLVDPSAGQGSRIEFGEPNEPASITRQPEPLNRVRPFATEDPVLQPIVGKGNNQGWRARACGRG